MCLVREGRQNSVWNAHNQPVDEPNNVGVGIQLSRLSAIKIHRLEVLIVSGATPLEQTPFHEWIQGHCRVLKPSTSPSPNMREQPQRHGLRRGK